MIILIKFSIILIFFNVTKVSAQNDILNYDNSLLFARYLNKTKQYDFASQEYERMNYFWPNDSTILLELIETYRLNKRCDKFNYIKMLLFKDNLYNIPQSYKFSYLHFCLTCKEKDEDYKSILLSLPPTNHNFYFASYYWINRDYNMLKLISKKKPNYHNYEAIKLYELSNEFFNERYKSPVIAGMMSAILPGSGKAYAKKWGDGVISLLFVASNTYAAYRAFNKKGINSINGWLFSGISLSFYIANIVGSINAATLYNKNIVNNYHSNVENIIYSNF